MNKAVACLFACLLLCSAAHAQTAAPKVIFVGDDVTAAWQASPQFTANHNWVGKGALYENNAGSNEILANFQTNVVNQHPAFVHIMIGFSDAAFIKDSYPVYYALAQYQSNITQMVAMAKKAGIKVILGNSVYQAASDEDLEAIVFFNSWLDQYGRANNIPVVNYNAQFCQCTGAFSTVVTQSNIPLASLYLPGYIAADHYTLTSAGFALMTQMAQTAIATYGLSIRGGYLSDIELFEPNTYPAPPPLGPGDGPTPNVNTVPIGYALAFTPQATWSDGVTRPMLNADFDNMQGIWTSSNPNVMYISQQGQAIAIGPGTTSISFITADGHHFSPWTMTVEPVPLYGCC